MTLSGVAGVLGSVKENARTKGISQFGTRLVENGRMAALLFSEFVYPGIDI